MDPGRCVSAIRVSTLPSRQPDCAHLPALIPDFYLKSVRRLHIPGKQCGKSLPEEKRFIGLVVSVRSNSGPDLPDDLRQVMAIDGY